MHWRRADNHRNIPWMMCWLDRHLDNAEGSANRAGSRRKARLHPGAGARSISDYLSQEEQPPEHSGWLFYRCGSYGLLGVYRTGLPVLSSMRSPVTASATFSLIPRVSGVPSTSWPPVWIPGTPLPRAL